MPFDSQKFIEMYGGPTTMQYSKKDILFGVRYSTPLSAYLAQARSSEIIQAKNYAELEARVMAAGGKLDVFEDCITVEMPPEKP